MSLATASRSELTKQFTTSMWWILGLVLIAYVGSTAAGLGFVFAASADGSLPSPEGTNAPPAIDPELLPPVLYSLASSIGYVFPLLIGTLMVTNEFRHQTLTPTFLATPRRGVAMGGKLVVGVVMGAMFAVVGLIAAVGPGAIALSVFGFDTALDSADTWALLGRTAIALIIWVLIGIGVGTLVRNQVAAVVIVLAFTQFVEPIARTLAGLVDGLSEVLQFLPGAASDALVGASVFTTFTAEMGDLAELEWWAGGLVLLGYAAVLIILGHLFSWRRDVT